MAGGTGGHVYPALAVADRLRAAGVEVSWLGTRRGLEARVVPAADIALHFISISGLRGKGVATLAAAPFRLAWALLQSLAVVHRIRPDAVLGMGGFVAGPGGLAAWLLRRPLVIHEQNAVGGLTNRLLARLAGLVLTAFPASLPTSAPTRHTGNPVRRELLGAYPPEQRLAGRADALHLLVLGGSQGARSLNEVVPAALASLGPDQRVSVWHQAGPLHLEQARRAYAEAGAEGKLVDYIEDMAGAYAWADLVLCRSGAMTVAELCAVGVASILVPFPYAVDDHQTHNARFLADAGAAVLVSQSEFKPNLLRRLLTELGASRRRLLQMATAARALAMPEAAQRVADCCLEVAHG